MNITLRYLGQLGQLSECDEEVLESAPEQTMAALIHEAAARHGAAFQAIVFTESGAFRPSLMILVNGVPADKQALPALRAGDEITLLAAIAGG